MKKLTNLLPLVLLTLLVSCGSGSTDRLKLEECINGSESVCQELTPETPEVETPVEEVEVVETLGLFELEGGDTLTMTNDEGTEYSVNWEMNRYGDNSMAISARVATLANGNGEHFTYKIFADNSVELWIEESDSFGNRVPNSSRMVRTGTLTTVDGVSSITLEMQEVSKVITIL